MAVCVSDPYCITPVRSSCDSGGVSVPCFTLDTCHRLRYSQFQDMVIFGKIYMNL